MVSGKHRRVKCQICDSVMKYNNLKRHMQREDHNLGRGVEIDNGMKECERHITDSNRYDLDSEIDMEKM